ncbi:MAG TPA: hypothetical protein VK689_00775, partial [Armatimonadota bacterium]|nr:hypothetical protein [Armatimonadota bacterium]
TITTPRDMVRLGEELIVEGTATPGSRVVVEVSYRGRAFGALALKGTLGTQEATVDRRGNWATPPFEARLPLGVRRPELIIRAVSVDAAGQESEATVATLQTR